MGPDRAVTDVRRFNRFYTRQIGVLREGLDESPFSLAEARVLYELAHRDAPTASELSRDLQLDEGYLSRILRRFAQRGLLSRTSSRSDGRRTHLALTARGRKAFAALNAHTERNMRAMLEPLAQDEQRRLVIAMKTIEALLGDAREQRAGYVLRPPEPGDIGAVVALHGRVYAHEYGWDATFEALVAEIVAQFVRNFDPKGERCWVAERDGEVVGSVFIVRHSDSVAKLRLLIVAKSARGLGIGGRLVDEAIRFSRNAGYTKITLWTNDVLHAARRIYEDRGFRLIDEKPHHSFGADLFGQNWELEL